MDYRELIQRADDEISSGRNESARKILNDGLNYAEEQSDTGHALLL